MTADDLGAGPWGQDGSGTYVGEVRVLDIERAHLMLEGTVDEQVGEAVRLLAERGALDMRREGLALEVPAARGVRGFPIAVAVEPDRENLTRELLGAAAVLARDIAGHVVAFAEPPEAQAGLLAGAGADALVVVDGAEVEEDFASALASWAAAAEPWAVLLPSTAWGREVGGRAAARLGAGLTGDAVGLEVSEVVSTGEVQLLAWKPAFGGRLVAAIYASSPIQMATVRAGVLPRPAPRSSVPPIGSSIVTTVPRRRVRITLVEPGRRCRGPRDRAAGGLRRGGGSARRLCRLAAAARRARRRAGRDPQGHRQGMAARAHARSGSPAAASRPACTSPSACRGSSTTPSVCRAAGTVLAINSDRDAPIWDHADIGIVGEWRDVVPRLIARLEEQLHVIVQQRDQPRPARVPIDARRR